MGNKRFLKTFPLLFITTLVTFCWSSCQGNEILLDVSEVIKDAKQTEKLFASTVQLFNENNQGTKKANPVLLYLEIDSSDNEFQQLGNILGIVNNTEFNVKFLINIKTSLENVDDVKNYIPMRYTNIFSILNQYSSIINGISFHLTNVKDPCIQTPTTIAENSNHHMTLIQEVKQFLQQLSKENVFSIGYALDHDDLNCSHHFANIQHSDYVIINLALQRNDKILVESYGGFKENMEREIFKTLQKGFKKLDNTNQLMYFKISVNLKLDLENTQQPCSDKLGSLEVQKYLINTSIDRIEKAKESFTPRYETLLTQFCRRWVEDTSLVRVIIKHQQLHTGMGMETNKLSKYDNKSLIIPQIIQFPIKGSDNNLMLATSNLLEDVASSGFDTIMTNGDTWQTLVESEISLPNCTKVPCRPKNIWYNNNKHYSFSNYNATGVHKLLEVGGMHLSALVFSSYYNESESFPWANVTNVLKAGQVKGSQTINTACTRWPDVFRKILNKGEYNSYCASLDLRQVPFCHSLQTWSKLIVWRGILKLKNYDLDSFVEETMKKFDAVLMAREMVNVFYQGKEVILRIKAVYEGNGNVPIRYPIYCTELGENVSRIYETLLTWAQMHHFPIILEPITDGKGYNNPLTWQQLRTLAPGNMQKLMQSFPIFIRRTYNQSTVFGSWAKGMYPCIQQSQKNDNTAEINFNHKYAGVTLRMDLRLNETPLTSKELRTLLLFALKNFYALDIAVHTANQLKNFLDAVSRHDFAAALKSNQIGERKIYVELSMNVHINIKAVITRLIPQLQKYGFKVHMHISKPINNAEILNYNTLSGNSGQLLFGLIYDDCTKAAENMLSGKKNLENTNRMQYLICETSKSIPANNTDKVVMQDFLESHLYLKKLFQYFYPNLKEIHFRLHSTLVGGKPDEISLNQLLFLSDVNKFSKAYGIHYFLAPVIPSEWLENAESSFWTVTSYKNITGVSGYKGRLEGFVNQDTWKPTLIEFEEDTTSSPTSPPPILSSTRPPVSSSTSPPSTSYTPPSVPSSSNSPPSSSSTSLPESGSTPQTKEAKKSNDGDILYISIGVVSLIIMIIVVLLVFKTWRNRRYLSLEEANNFLHGRREILGESATKRRRNTRQDFNVFDGLVYQKEYEIPKNNISLNKKEIMSKGKFSNVYRGIMEGSESELEVEVCNHRSSKDKFRTMLSEAKMLCYIGNHVNIVRFTGCYTREIRKGVLWIIREYCNEGNLLEYLKTSKDNQISLNEMIRFAKEIACGMKHLSNQNVVHGDLRAKHVYLDQHKVCKVGNFGLNRKILEYKKLVMEEKWEFLPWRWMAPETYTSLEFSHQSDVFAYGVTVWEIFSSGEIPYGAAAHALQSYITGLVNGERLPCPSNAEEIYEALLESWNLKPEMRPEFCKFINLFADMLQSSVDVESVREEARTCMQIATPTKTDKKTHSSADNTKDLPKALQEEEKEASQGIALQSNHELSKENLQVHFDQILGVSQFGIVHRATLRHNNPIDVAVKMIRDNSPAGTLQGMSSEIDLLCTIGNHSNVVKFVGCYTAEIQQGVLWIVTELCSHGSLLSFLREKDAERTKTKLPVRDMYKFAFEIASGMEYISGKNIIHGDLAARNVLLDADKTCKIGDFGLSRNLYKYEMYIKTRQDPLPWKWLAYEALKKSEYSVQSDVWSFGITLWEIFTLGDVPYPGLAWTVDFVNQLENGLRLPHPKHATTDTYEIMKQCWRIWYEERPTFSNLAKHLNEKLLRETSHNVINMDTRLSVVNFTPFSPPPYVDL